MSQPTHPGFSELASDLVELKRPDEVTGYALDNVRSAFADLIAAIGGYVPDGPDATVAARSIHRACQDVIFAVVHNQES